MKIMITGSYGQLGNEIQDILKNKKADIGVISDQYDNAEIAAVDVDSLDITDIDAVKAFVGKERPDLIINCAAMTNVDGCERNFEGAMKVNAFGPANLAFVADEIGAKFVHVSTDYVFRGDGNIPRAEWDETAPNTVYGKSKIIGEKYVSERCKRYFIFRTSWLYGLVGKNFVKTMRKVGRNHSEISVVDDQIGNPTNANDLAYHILKAAITENYGIYHCTGEGECSWADFAEKIMEFSHISCKIKRVSSEEYAELNNRNPDVITAPRPKYSSLNNLTLKCTIGNEMRDWVPALESYITKLGENDE